MKTDELLKLYSSGLTYRQIQTKTGINFRTVHYRLSKIKGHRVLVTKVLRDRCNNTLDIAPARVGKLARYIFARERPKQFARWLSGRGPKLPAIERFGDEWRSDCPKCMNKRSVYAKGSRGSAAWHCCVCDAEGIA